MLQDTTVRRRKRQRLRCREGVRDVFIASSPAAVHCVDDLVPAAEVVAGCSITVVDVDDLGEFVQGYTSRAPSGSAVVELSRVCACRDFTLAHELGHLVLGHRMGPCTYDNGLGVLQGIYKHSHEEMQEREADLFARNMLWTLEHGAGATTESHWRWLYQIAGDGAFL